MVVAEQLYLDLLEKVVTNLIYQDPALAAFGYPSTDFHQEARESGMDWPSTAHTMVGLRRLQNVRSCLDQVAADGVAGDFVETGVWRGGVCIFVRGYWKVHGIVDRQVWVADSFEGIPETGDDGHPLDRGMGLHSINGILRVSLDAVKENFARYELLDDQVKFLPGWFRDTLPEAPIDKLAILRLDGDLYESTMNSLDSLYHKLSPGGFVIIDDYCIPACRVAVQEFRNRLAIRDPIEVIDQCGVFWRRSA